jgi:hypothetical protein
MLRAVRVCPASAGSTILWIVYAFMNEAFYEDICSHRTLFLSVDVCGLFNGICYKKNVPQKLKQCRNVLVNFSKYKFNLFFHSFIHSLIHSFIINCSTALHGPWPLLQFRNLLHTDSRNPWRTDQPVARPLSTYRTTQTQNKCTQTSMPWVGFESTIPGFEWVKTVDALDRAATVNGK